MNILTQNYNELVKKITIEIFFFFLTNKLNTLLNLENVFNYINLLSNLDDNLNKLARESLINFFEELDKNFSSSKERKKKYEIKSHHPRTILTIFGEITYNRTFYKSKLNGKNYCFVDRFLGLHKYDYFDPYLKSLVIEYAANNSMPKTANYINNLIGNRLSLEQKFKYFSRQTIRNIILSAKLSKPFNDFKETTPETLYIIADEKWIHTQNNNKQDIMEKSIVLFEKIDNHKLIKKQIFASMNHTFIDDCLDYIYNSYDIDKIKTIYCMGDGANWIKNLRNYFHFSSNSNVINALDKFHFKQAIHQICFDSNLEKIMLNYILNKELKNFKNLCSSLCELYPYRSQTIKDKSQYILNNWITIHNLYDFKLNCPMESQISHNIADLFTSRPKAYSKKMIKKLMHIRLLFKNNYNIKYLYLNNFNSKKTLKITKEHLNFNIYGNPIPHRNVIKEIANNMSSDINFFPFWN